MKLPIKYKIKRWWNKPNPEGVSPKDAFFVSCFWLTLLLIIGTITILLK